jgi:hypothetical protein
MAREKVLHDVSTVWCAGHGIMWDGAVNKELTSLLESALNRDAIVATCGHGAVALLEVKTKHNATVDYFVKNKEASHLLPTAMYICMLTGVKCYSHSQQAETELL